MDLSDIEEQWTFLRLMHPAHLAYIKEFPLNTLRYFLKTLHVLEPEKRYEILSMPTWLLYVPDTDGDEVRAICEDRENLFVKFGVKCQEVIETFNEALFVMAIVQYILHYLSGRGDKTSIERNKQRLIGLVENLQKIPVKEAEQESADKVIDQLVDGATDMPETTEAYYSLYVYFCENVVDKLLDEHLNWPLPGSHEN